MSETVRTVLDVLGLFLVCAAITLGVALIASLIWAFVVVIWMAGVGMLAFSRLTKPAAPADEAKP